MRADAKDHPRSRRLPPLYYLNYVRLALANLRSRYGGLLSDEEVGLIEGFESLAEPAQCLLARLAMRKGPIYRRSTLNYDEIGDVPGALDALLRQGWIDPDPKLSPAELFLILDRAELRLVFGAAGSSSQRNAPTATLEQFALPLVDEQLPQRKISSWHPWLAGRFMALVVEPLLRRLQLLFFGNDTQDWAQFVLTDLGTFRYESVPLALQSRAFQARDEIEDFYRLQKCRAQLRAGATAMAVRDLATPPPQGPAWLRAQFARLHVRLGEQLEVEGSHELALSTYRACDSTAGWVKAARLQERLGRHEAARRDALTARAQPCSESELELLDRVLVRCDRRLDGVREPRRPRAQPETLELTLPPLAQGRKVESAVAAQLALADAPVFSVENGLVTSLFGLLCWEALFFPVPGAFFHPFQAGPSDLHAPEFRPRRGALFDALLSLLDSGEHEAVIWRNYRAKAGIHTRFVRWGKLKPRLLTVALHCIPGAHLKLCFERLLDNLKDNVTGLPDLIQFWPEERRYRMIEVKAPGDRLQDNQRRWMKFFARHAMPAVVCRVRWEN